MKAIKTKYLGPTNFKGSRIAASDLDGNRVIVSYDSAANTYEAHKNAVRALCKKMHWSGELIGGYHKGFMSWVFIGDPYLTLEVKDHD